MKTVCFLSEFSTCTLSAHRYLLHFCIICSCRSVDDQLKWWKTDTSSCILSYSGHTNKTFFVGLDVFEDLIACGK